MAFDLLASRAISQGGTGGKSTRMHVTIGGLFPTGEANGDAADMGSLANLGLEERDALKVAVAMVNDQDSGFNVYLKYEDDTANNGGRSWTPGWTALSQAEMTRSTLTRVTTRSSSSSPPGWRGTGRSSETAKAHRG
eukprot:TRINITY_DN1741_c0_g1_i1.p1 TRINITY_DN1741_c0_g1~~TRINITY_DN1741_c0_g1_i1.p1  ORF type:complete len:153 (+),score=22.24 TRINITY_DN1741_c0_g1_i1:49-459(+)